MRLTDAPDSSANAPYVTHTPTRATTTPETSGKQRSVIAVFATQRSTTPHAKDTPKALKSTPEKKVFRFSIRTLCLLNRVAAFRGC
jgi:hypothetical protein